MATPRLLPENRWEGKEPRTLQWVWTKKCKRDQRIYHKRTGKLPFMHKNPNTTRKISTSVLRFLIMLVKPQNQVKSKNNKSEQERTAYLITVLISFIQCVCIFALFNTSPRTKISLKLLGYAALEFTGPGKGTVREKARSRNRASFQFSAIWEPLSPQSRSISKPPRPPHQCFEEVVDSFIVR